MVGRVTRSMSKLKREGLQEWIEGLSEDGFDGTPSLFFGYPLQAHHCISCSVMQNYENGKLANLAINSNYDINNGVNCILLPAKFGHMRINNEQRHRGGHSDDYYNYVKSKLDPIWKKYKNEKPCKGNKAAQDILSALQKVEKIIYKDLESRKQWLYDWSEELYNKDYREEGPGDLTMDNVQGSSSAGLEWTKAYPKGSARRKYYITTGKVKTRWYESKGFPVPRSVKS